VNGSPCETGAECHWGIDPPVCGMCRQAFCVDGAWQVSGPSCAYSCAAVLPVAGEFCEAFWQSTTCRVEACGGGTKDAFACVEGVWQLVPSEGEDEATCVANGCVWRAEECGGNALLPAGCYPSTCTGETATSEGGSACGETFPVCGQQNFQ
jgi:hypothetical protein